MENITIKIGGMHCVRCSASLEKALNNEEGIKASVSYASEKASVEYDSSIVSYKQICKIIKKVGFYVIEENKKDNEFRKTLVLFVLSAVLTIPFFIMMILMLANSDSKLSEFLHNGVFQIVITTPIQFVVGYKFYKGAYNSLKGKSPNMDLLVALGTSIAYFYSLYNLIRGINEYYFESSAFIITLVYLGKLLEMKSKNKTNEALSSLMKLRPNRVTVIKDSRQVEIDIDDLVIDDIFIVRAGENVASDGVIINGSASIDESMVTGESLPKYKSVNDEVIGGTVSTDGVIEVRVTKVGEDSTLSKIVKLVEDAESSKAKVQKLADKVSSIFVPSIVVIALASFIVNYLISKDVSLSISRAVAVLVIACPCSLGLATPMALIVGMGKAARKGVLIKNADTLESMCKIKTIVLDKTGTITSGQLEVGEVVVKEEVKYDEFSKLVSKIESNSKHVVAKAIANYFGDNNIKISKIKEIAGKGIEAFYEGKTVKVGSYNWLGKYSDNTLPINKNKLNVLVVMDNVLIGIISLQDSVKQSSLSAISKLKENDIELVLASGDSKAVCESIGTSLGINKVYSEVMPSDKHRIINEYKSNGLVAMVGDGINDAPALASSDVGIAMGNGLDIAIESCDIVIMNNDLNSINTAYVISKATMRKIKQNLFWAFFYNCIGIPLAFIGLLSPVIAGLCMSLSSVSVVMNSLLLNKAKG